MKESDNPSDSEWAEVEFMQQVMPFNMVLHEVYSTAESMYLVMPMLPNGRLKDWLRRNRKRTVEQARPIAAQIAFGLWELHQRGVMHRDIKTGNIMMLDGSGANVTIIDYNRAAFGCRGQHGGPCTDQPAGTGFYQAWSTKVGRPYSYEVDWWSFGVVLYRFALMTPFGCAFERYGPPRYLNVTTLEGRDPALVNLLNATIGTGYLSLKTPEARAAMESPVPDAHPILSNDFWLVGVNFTPETRAKALRDYWSGICKSHAADPEVQCAQLFKEKPVKKFKRSCNEVAVASCCCRKSACTRNATDLGVDSLPAVEGSSGKTAVCCTRQLKCGGAYPYMNTTVGGNASCA